MCVFFFHFFLAKKLRAYSVVSTVLCIGFHGCDDTPEIPSDKQIIPPFQVQSGRIMRERVFPLSKNSSPDSTFVCPSVKPSTWTDTWFETCRRMESEKSEIKKRDSTTREIARFPNSIDNIETFDDSEDSKIFTLRSLRKGEEVLLYRGTSEDSRPPRSAVFKYQLNCLSILFNTKCDVQRGSGNVSPICAGQLGEDLLLNEFIFSRIIFNKFKNDSICAKVFSLSPPVVPVNKKNSISSSLI